PRTIMDAYPAPRQKFGSPAPRGPRKSFGTNVLQASIDPVRNSSEFLNLFILNEHVPIAAAFTGRA
ncbi:MAG TPA: hypothetical protein VFR37_08070, partial [Longimicrobium sp.]|nr:hypothetical protein [Longimicrobium sp.]